MKLRQRPEDFIVREISDFRPDPKGHFFVYEMTKRGIATLEALDVLSRALRVSRHDARASGLKDKHALATQLISLPAPLPAEFADSRLSLRFAGKSACHVERGLISGNHFDITARSLSDEEVERIQANAALLPVVGVPNYYDSQRFGSAGKAAGWRDESAGKTPGDAFSGKALLLGRHEEALRLHLAVPRRKQAMRDKRIRRECARRWGDWATLLRKLPRSSERSIIDWLVNHPCDYRGALARIDSRLTTLYLAAYQSLLFNLALTRMIQEAFAEEATAPSPLRTAKYRGGEMVFWEGALPERLRHWEGETLPLLAHSTRLEEFTPEAQSAVEWTLAHEGVALKQLVTKGFDRLVLRPGKRDIVLRPREFVLDEPVEDELNPGRRALTARFTLPRGSFATVVMKFLGSPSVGEEHEGFAAG